MNTLKSFSPVATEGANESGSRDSEAVAAQESTERVNILGVGASAINMGMALRRIDQWIQKRDNNYVCITGVHGVIESQSDPRLRKIHSLAAFVTPDSTPLVWVLQ